jgi:hypothetical protein
MINYRAEPTPSGPAAGCEGWFSVERVGLRCLNRWPDTWR